MCELAFLGDLMDHLNQLNLHLQANGHLISTLVSHVKAFEMKLRLWITQMEQKDVTYVITLKTVENENLQYEKYSSIRAIDERFQYFKKYYVDIGICWQFICSQC